MISEFRSQSDIAIDQLKEDLRTVRTGRAHPSLVDSVQIDAYGGSTKMHLKELSTITTEGPTTIIIVPFDPGTIPDIEKGILASPLGLTPKNQGNRILITIPPMNEEQREKMIKLVGQMVEDKKEYIRKKRDEARKKIKHAADAKEMGEDEKYRLEKDLDTETHDLMEEIQKIKDHKEKEIREV